MVGLVFGYVCRMFKRFTLAASLLIQAVAFVILVAAPSLGVIAIGGMVYGLGVGIQMVAACYYILESVEQDASSMAIAVCMTLTSFGVTFSPVVVNLFVPGELNGTNGLMVGAVGMLVCFVIEVAYCLIFNKDSKIGMD